MRKVSILLLLFIALLTHDVGAQDLYGRKHKDIFPSSFQYHPGGWHFAPGVTYMTPPFFQFSKQENQPQTTPRGRLGLYIEFGRYRILEYWSIFKYMDYGIAYKSLRGKELSGGGEALFGDHFIDAFINFNNVWAFSDRLFLQNTLGANLDYSFIRNAGGTVPSKLLLQLHYKIGFGFKVRSKLLIIPSLETPILNGLPWEWGKSTLPYYQSRFRPLVLSVRFLFFRPIREKACIPVPAPDLPDGYKIPTDMDMRK